MQRFGSALDAHTRLHGCVTDGVFRRDPTLPRSSPAGHARAPLHGNVRLALLSAWRAHATTGQRPKLEDYEGYLFIVLKMLSYGKKDDRVDAEQVCLIVGPNYVISFQEKPGDLFDPVRERIRNGKGRTRRMGADYLAYVLIDAIVDNYFTILEQYGEKIEAVEEKLVNHPTPDNLRAIHRLKGEMIFLRKSVWPLREVISVLERSITAGKKNNRRLSQGCI